MQFLSLFLYRQSGFLLTAFQDFLFFLFSVFEYDMVRCMGGGGSYPACCSLQKSCISGLVSVINFGKFSAIITSNISSALCLLSFCYSNNVYVIPFKIVPQFLDILFHSFSLFSLCISGWVVCIDMSSCLLILSVSSLLMSPSKASFLL